MTGSDTGCIPGSGKVGELGRCLGLGVGHLLSVGIAVSSAGTDALGACIQSVTHRLEGQKEQS